MVLLSTRIRPPSDQGAGALVRLACDAGFSGLAVDGGCFFADLPALAAEGLKAGVPLEACFGPVAVEPLPKGKRLPYLAALDDKEERLEATKLAQRNIEAARAHGARLVVLDMGLVELRADEAELRLRFSRAEMGEGEPGRRLLARALEERRGHSGKVLDACRATLEPLGRVAEAVGATLVLLPAPAPWHAPSPRELEILLRELSGAPIAPGWAPGWRAALATLGAGGPEGRWEAFRAAARLVYATDAVGLARDLLPGLGEAWDDPPPLPAGAPVIVSGRADTTDGEARAARELVDRLTASRAAPTAGS